MAPLELSAHMTVRPGRLEGFKKQAAELIRIRNILGARTKLFKDYADDHSMTFYGEVSEPLLNLLKKHAAGHKWFSFLRGLEPSAVIPPQILVAAREATQPV